MAYSSEKYYAKTRGYYTFADGFTAWYYGLTGDEKRKLVREHGKIVRFEHTN